MPTSPSANLDTAVKNNKTPVKQTFLLSDFIFLLCIESKVAFCISTGALSYRPSQSK